VTPPFCLRVHEWAHYFVGRSLGGSVEVPTFSPDGRSGSTKVTGLSPRDFVVSLLAGDIAQTIFGGVGSGGPQRNSDFWEADRLCEENGLALPKLAEEAERLVRLHEDEIRKCAEEEK